MRVSIGKALANEYLTRGVFEFIEDAGVYELTPEQMAELRVDAQHYCDKDGPDMTPASVKAAYRRLLEQLR